MNNIDKLIKARQDKFVETRTIIESEVNRFLESLGGLDDDVKQRVGYKPGYTARKLLPALWEEPFDVNVYNSQLAVVKQYIAQVTAICDEINKEALQCLQSV